MRLTAIAIILAARPVFAQQESPATDAQPKSETESAVASSASEPATAPAETDETLEGTEESKWSVGLSVFTYIVPEDSDYVQPTLSIDRDWLHLEARYNYEDLDTASVWVGYNFSFGEELTLDFTPMVGGVFGDTRGVAPGYEVTLAWREFELYTEGEYIFDADDSADNFFYSWSELTYAPTDWLRTGLAVQRTKIRAEATDIELGPMIGLTYKSLDFSAYVLFPEEGDPTVALAVAIEF